MDANNEIWFGGDGTSIPSRKTFLSDIAVDGPPATTIWLHSDAGHNHEAREEGKGLDSHDPFATPKPERLLERILHIATNPTDLVLDSFLGSGTTAAVAHKMGRRWIGIEMGEHAATHCLPRLQKVLDGEQGGISKSVGWGDNTLLKPWTGGGFRFMRLGSAVFDETGRINPQVRFATLAAFIWQQETSASFDPDRAQPATPYLGTHYKISSELLNLHVNNVADSSKYSDAPPETASKTAFLATAPLAASNQAANETESPAWGVSNRSPQFALYLLFNGILGDKRPASGNVLTHAVLDALLALHASSAAPQAPLIVYGEACRLGEARLKQANVTFKHIPYDVRAR